jgi:hypothetical protein
VTALSPFGRVDAEVAAARGARAEALAAYCRTVLQATANVESAITAPGGARTSQNAGRRRGGAGARGASRIAYQAGNVSLIEVLDANDRLLATRDQRAQAQFEAARGCHRRLQGARRRLDQLILMAPLTSAASYDVVETDALARSVQHRPARRCSLFLHCAGQPHIVIEHKTGGRRTQDWYELRRSAVRKCRLLFLAM